MGLKVSSLYIAQVRQKYGIIERENYNLPEPDNSRQPALKEAVVAKNYLDEKELRAMGQLV